MKNLILLIAVLALMNLNACGQKTKNVPINVKATFSQKFPNATKVKWDMENMKEWEAEFKMNGKEYSANFDTNGVWLETEYEVGINDIPEIVRLTINKEFADYTIKESEISETADGKVYEFELKKRADKIEVSIDFNGKVLKKENAKDEDND